MPQQDTCTIPPADQADDAHPVIPNLLFLHVPERRGEEGHVGSTLIAGCPVQDSGILSRVSGVSHAEPGLSQLDLILKQKPEVAFRMRGCHTALRSVRNVVGTDLPEPELQPNSPVGALRHPD